MGSREGGREQPFSTGRKSTLKGEGRWRGRGGGEVDLEKKEMERRGIQKKDVGLCVVYLPYTVYMYAYTYILYT